MSERGSSAKSLGDDSKVKSKGLPKRALYREYRPTSLDEVIGQPQVTDILKSSLERNEFSHAYLLTGQRGTGKTSVARILAHLINQTEYGSGDIDIIEIDAASRGSVDDARELRDKAFIAPVSATHKIYIIDEVHMLSTPAFNALLKIIEEPPEHVVFIMATTELNKVPATILSRVQRFHFKPVDYQIVADHLATIAKQEKVKADPAALELIARHGGGSFRDSISLLDQLSKSNANITRDQVEQVLGLAPETQLQSIIQALSDHDVTGIVQTIRSLIDAGIGPVAIADQLIDSLAASAPDKPKLYDLIEKLLEVSKSTAPEIKLLAVLSIYASKSSPNTVMAAETNYKTDNKLAAIIEREISHETNTVAADSEVDTSNETVVAHSDSELPDNIVWQDVIEEVKKMDSPAALATLKLASTEYENRTLTLYFERAFHRKKADAANCRKTLQTACENLYGAAPTITVASGARLAADSKDSLIAGVAAIMGGGDIIRET